MTRLLVYGARVACVSAILGFGYGKVIAQGSNPGGETIVATGIHRFWKAGVGWVMARDLKPGDPVRTLDGRVGVVSVESGIVQPVFNLELSTGKSFFVGKQGVLVHDNTTVDPVQRPFDSEPVLASIGIPQSP